MINIFESLGRLTEVESKIFNLDLLSNTRLTSLHLVSLKFDDNLVWVGEGGYVCVLRKDIRWQSSTKLESKGATILLKNSKAFYSNSFYPTLSGILEISRHSLREYWLFLLYFHSRSTSQLIDFSFIFLLVIRSTQSKKIWIWLCVCSVSIVDFEQVNVRWVLTSFWCLCF